MGSKIKEARIESFVGGINTYASPTQVKDNESPDMLNCVFSGLTGISKRQGYTKLTTSPVNGTNKIQGIFSYITNSVREILYVSGGNLYRYNNLGSSTLITGGSFDSSANVNAAQIGDRLYLVDGVSNLQYYNGSSLLTTGVNLAPSAISQVIKYNNRLYCTTNTYKDRIYFGGSIGSDGTATNTGNFDSASPSYGGFFSFGLGKEVVGFAKMNTVMYVFLKDSIHQISPVANTGSSSALDHSESTISNSIGCRSSRSIENVENDIFFIDNTVYSLGEVRNYVAIRTTNVSGKVQKLFSNLLQSAVSDITSIYYDKEEMFLVSVQTSGSSNDHIIGYHLPYKAWFYWDGFKVNSFLDYIDSNSVKHLYFGSDDSSYIYEMFQGLLDDGLAVSAYYKTKQFDLTKFNIEKIFQSIAIQFGGTYGVVTIKFYVDGVLAETFSVSSGTNVGTSDGWGTLPIGTFLFGLEGSYTEASTSSDTIANDWRWHNFTTSPNGTTFQIEFSNNNPDESFEIRQTSVGFLELSYYKRNSAREI